MGVGQSQPLFNPAAMPIIIEQGACTCQPRSVPCVAPPPWLPANQVVWDSFIRELQAQVKRMWTEVWFLLFGIVGFSGVLLVTAIPGLTEAGMYTSFIAVVGVFAGIGGMSFARMSNQNVDSDIDQVCQRYSSQLGVGVAYVRQWTGVCKPKHARTFRAVVVAPPGQPPIIAVNMAGLGAYAFNAVQVGGPQYQHQMQVNQMQGSVPMPVHQMQQPPQGMQPQQDIPVAVAVPVDGYAPERK
uniref:Uncharacterized protein n=1 Tax=Hemiselmis tepida TaxID=464990 RepID=A0A7S0VWS5_9CRYP|mmetsp:Transcript_30731/g.77745  ORF Transcript_30731/g.77745 Transcript_30731/m.77745 type:complete len:242 (+) Transcript_30731:92-817(+)|eukprot:CAMPEP_0174918450 /NCGR_PEP_ID=MMETSP1355-20121228/3076_1 /TAXON_ID=464990 /ORGANISM="Hemiselmis tepida, Strain CCMP443" /LENGTH=241 /DNA_ID=CAMNT_0016163627 /DNA_START=65 /DNA_END=790 /DNA_ORIENTATION=-